MDYIELNLLEMLDTYGEDKLQSILSRFMCPQNIDMENFIQTKAIGFAVVSQSFVCKPSN